jgi:hypothetical protein
MVGHTPADAVTCKGDAGGPSLREVAGRLELVGLHHSSAQTGCVGATGTGAGVTETRVDDLRSWVMAKTLADVPWSGQAHTGPALHQSLSATGAWSGFTTVNGYRSAIPAGAKDVAVTGLPNGSLQVLVVGWNDQVHHRARNASGTWTEFHPLNGYGTPDPAAGKQVAIAGLPDNSSQVLITGTDDRIYHRARFATGDWTQFVPLNGEGTTTPAKGKDVAIAGLPNGTAQVLVVGWDDRAYHRVRNANGSWTEFAPVTASVRPAAPRSSRSPSAACRTTAPNCWSSASGNAKMGAGGSHEPPAPFHIRSPVRPHDLPRLGRRPHHVVPPEVGEVDRVRLVAQVVDQRAEHRSQLVERFDLVSVEHGSYGRRRVRKHLRVVEQGVDTEVELVVVPRVR